MQLSPFEDGTIEVVFGEVTGKYIDGLVFLQKQWHDTIQIHPIIKY
jgi:hypothetical protein